jgi:hypothetical protein
VKPPSAQPLFLARQSYRRRRLMDAARLLPFLGAFLFLIPVLWRGADGGARSTASDGIYLIVVWAGLIVAAFVISRALMHAPEAPPATGPAETPVTEPTDRPGA